MNAVEPEPVETRVLNPNAGEARHKPKQRSYRKTNLKFFYFFFRGDFGRGDFVKGILSVNHQVTLFLVMLIRMGGMFLLVSYRRNNHFHKLFNKNNIECITPLNLWNEIIILLSYNYEIKNSTENHICISKIF